MLLTLKQVSSLHLARGLGNLKIGEEMVQSKSNINLISKPVLCLTTTYLS